MTSKPISWPFIAASLVVLSDVWPAAADTIAHHADLVCDPSRKLAVARFAEAYNEDLPAYRRIPESVDGGLSGEPPSRRTTCRLANGWEVKVRSGTGQAFAHGEGGGGPGGFFSLWVNKRKVVSKRLWTSNEYAEKRLPLRAVVITADALRFCEGEDGSQCSTQPLNPFKLARDRLEYPDPGVPRVMAGVMTLLRASEPRLCRSLIKVERNPDGTREDTINSTQGELGEEWIDTSDVRSTFDLTRLGGAVRFPRAAFDLEGDGRVDTIVGRRESSNSFDGSFWIVAPGNVAVADVLRRLYEQDKHVSEEEAITRAKQAGWSVFAGGQKGLYPDVSPNYVHLELRNWRGKFYFLAYPLNEKHDPTAILIRPEPKARFKTVCVFQRVRPNF